MAQIKVSKTRNSKEAAQRLTETVEREKKAGNPVAQKIRSNRSTRAKNLTVGVTQPELEFLSAQQTLTLSSPKYLKFNHNGRESTSNGNEASNIINLVMELCDQVDDTDYRKWLPEMVEKMKSEKKG